MNVSSFRERLPNSFSSLSIDPHLKPTREQIPSDYKATNLSPLGIVDAERQGHGDLIRRLDMLDQELSNELAEGLQWRRDASRGCLAEILEYIDFHQESWLKEVRETGTEKVIKFHFKEIHVTSQNIFLLLEKPLSRDAETVMELVYEYVSGRWCSLTRVQRVGEYGDTGPQNRDQLLSMESNQSAYMNKLMGIQFEGIAKILGKIKYTDDSDTRTTSWIMPMFQDNFEILSSQNAAQKFNLASIINLMGQSGRALGQLHDRGIAHRSIKQDVLLLNPIDRTTCVADWECSIGGIEIMTSEHEDAVQEVVGFVECWPPEMFELIHKPPFNIKDWQRVDVFGLGICWYLLIMRKQPTWIALRGEERGDGRLKVLKDFSNKNSPVYQAYQRDLSTLNPSIWTEGLVLRMLDPNPKTRFTMKDVMRVMKHHLTRDVELQNAVLASLRTGSVIDDDQPGNTMGTYSGSDTKKRDTLDIDGG